MNPSVRLPPVVPFTCHVTPVFVLPATVAENCCVPKLATLAATGEMTTETFDGVDVAVTVSAAVPDFIVSLCEIARTVTCAGLGTALGAVYSPVLEIVPFALPPTTLQLTALFDVSATVAVNCRAVPTTTFTPVGVMLTEITRPAVPLLQPAAKITRHTRGTSERARLIRVLNRGKNSL